MFKYNLNSVIFFLGIIKCLFHNNGLISSSTLTFLNGLFFSSSFFDLDSTCLCYTHTCYMQKAKE